MRYMLNAQVTWSRWQAAKMLLRLRECVAQRGVETSAIVWRFSFSDSTGTVYIFFAMVHCKQL